MTLVREFAIPSEEAADIFELYPTSLTLIERSEAIFDEISVLAWKTSLSWTMASDSCTVHTPRSSHTGGEWKGRGGDPHTVRFGNSVLRLLTQ